MSRRVPHLVEVLHREGVSTCFYCGSLEKALLLAGRLARENLRCSDRVRVVCPGAASSAFRVVGRYRGSASFREGEYWAKFVRLVSRFRLVSGPVVDRVRSNLAKRAAAVSQSV